MIALLILFSYGFIDDLSILSILECVKVDNEDSESCETSQIKKLKRRNEFHSSCKPGVHISNKFKVVT